MFMEAAVGHVLTLKDPALPPGKPKLESQLYGTLGKTLDLSEPVSGGP